MRQLKKYSFKYEYINCFALYFTLDIDKKIDVVMNLILYKGNIEVKICRIPSRKNKKKKPTIRAIVFSLLEICHEILL